MRYADHLVVIIKANSRTNNKEKFSKKQNKFTSSCIESELKVSAKKTKNIILKEQLTEIVKGIQTLKLTTNQYRKIFWNIIKK